MQLPTEAEFKEWLENPVTIAFRHALTRRADDYLQAWESGSFTNERADQTMQLNSNAIGSVQTLRMVLAMDYDDLIEMNRADK